MINTLIPVNGSRSLSAGGSRVRLEFGKRPCISTCILIGVKIHNFASS